MKRPAVLGVLALLIFAACGSGEDFGAASDGGDSVPAAPTGDEPTDDPLAGEWRVIGLTVDGEQVVVSDEQPVTMTVADGRVTGTAACNGYGGTLASSDHGGGGSFVVADLSWTEMACEPEVMAIEQQFLSALQAVDSYEVADDLFVAATSAPTSFRLARP